MTADLIRAEPYLSKIIRETITTTHTILVVPRVTKQATAQVKGAKDIQVRIKVTFS